MRGRTRLRSAPPRRGLQRPASSRRKERMDVRAATLIVTLAVGLLVGPRAAEAQPQAGKAWRVGALMSLFSPDSAPSQAFRQRLHELGYVEGQNLVVEWRYTEGRDDRLP